MPQHVDLAGWYAAMDMGADLVRFRRRRVVDVTTDILQFVILGRDSRACHDTGIAGHIATFAIDVDNLVH